MEKILISESIGSVPFQVDEAAKSRYTLLLAHGAGAPMVHTFMQSLAVQLAALDARVVRFNFPYIQNGKRMPGSPKPNIETIGAMVEFIKKKYQEPLFLSGKSYGGRMSSHWVAEHPDSGISGLVYFGFPLHAPGKPGKERAGHLSGISIPQLFIQGTRDSLADLGLITEVSKTCLKATLHVVASADHSFNVPKSIQLTKQQVIRSLAEITNRWCLQNIK